MRKLLLNPWPKPIARVTRVPESPMQGLVVGPNPAQGHFTASYGVEQAGEVSLELVPIGNFHLRSAILFQGHKEAGVFREAYNVGHLPNGLYMLRLNTASGSYSKKIFIQNP